MKYETLNAPNAKRLEGEALRRKVKELIAELDAEHFPAQAEPKGYRTVYDASGFPYPIYDAPPINRTRVLE